MSNLDPWDIGTLYKPLIWVFYILSNYSGVLFCSHLIYVVKHNPDRLTSDIFVCGLASGCLTMSITCGTQCLLNLIANRFYGGVVACQIEAIAHISAVLTEFLCVTSLSIGMYFSVVRSRAIEQKTALKIIVIIWLCCTIITCLLSLVSPIYLMSAGTYCFFAFSSVAIAGWLVSGLVIALGTMLVCHIKIVRHLTKMVPNNTLIKTLGQSKTISQHDIWMQQFQWRSTLFMITLLIGWGFAAVTVIYELSAGYAAEWLVTAVGVGGVSFSWFVPLVFLYTSPHYRAIMGVCSSRCQQLIGSCKRDKEIRV